MKIENENEKTKFLKSKIILSDGVKGLVDLLLEDVVVEDLKSFNSGDCQNGTETDQSIA